MVAEGASGVGNVIISKTAVYTIVRVSEAVIGIELALATTKTFGEDLVRLSQAEKQEISHQGYGFQEILKRAKELLGLE